MNLLKQIYNVVVAVTEVDFIRDKRRNRDLADARIIFGSLSRLMTKETTSSIGDFMGRNHSSVTHYFNKADHLKKYDEKFRDKYENCLKEIDSISGGDFTAWSRMNYHLRMANQYKNILRNG